MTNKLQIKFDKNDKELRNACAYMRALEKAYTNYIEAWYKANKELRDALGDKYISKIKM